MTALVAPENHPGGRYWVGGGEQVVSFSPYVPSLCVSVSVSHSPPLSLSVCPCLCVSVSLSPPGLSPLSLSLSVPACWAFSFSGELARLALLFPMPDVNLCVMALLCRASENELVSHRKNIQEGTGAWNPSGPRSCYAGSN